MSFAACRVGARVSSALIADCNRIGDATRARSRLNVCRSRSDGPGHSHAGASRSAYHVGRGSRRAQSRPRRSQRKLAQVDGLGIARRAATAHLGIPAYRKSPCGAPSRTRHHRPRDGRYTSERLVFLRLRLPPSLPLWVGRIRVHSHTVSSPNLIPYDSDYLTLKD